MFVEDPVSGEWVKESVAWDEGRIFFDVPFIVDSTVVDDPLVEDRGYRDCWYATDHLGNVRAVIDITPGLPVPQVVEQCDYLPFGTKILNPSHASMPSNRWRYAGKEEQAFGSLNLGLLDFGARMYDPFTARWTAVDPMAGKYYDKSPFNYCSGNPIGVIDVKGDSLAILNLGGLIGHSALLIQNAAGQWEYYSMNGDKIFVATKGAHGGKDRHDKGAKTFDSVQSFLDSDYNREGNLSEIEEDEVNNYGFPEAYVIPTTAEQDKKAKSTFEEETGIDYDFLGHNCSIVADRALLSAGVRTGSKEGAGHIIPQNLFNYVRKNNKGTYIKRR